MAAGLIGGLLVLAALVWHVMIGGALAWRIEYGEAAGSCVGCLGLIMLAFVVMAGIGILSRATAPQ
jgi:hypothetical protein